MDDSNNYFTRNREEMLAFLPQGFNNVLEIGCGEGEFGRLVKEEHITNYTAIEADLDSARVAEKHLDRVLIGDAFEQLQLLDDKSYDLLICNDILEHIILPDVLLKKIRSKMKPNAILVCSLPNFRVLGNMIHILVKKDFEYSEWGIRDTTHLRFFTKKSINRFFTDNEFKMEEIKGINPINTVKAEIPLRFLHLLGHGDMRYNQYAIVAKF
jgi:2-polyprenyl-3-methyl-5-hydroxy-6-metoxy-1,4-benzoquinol methylase